MKLMTISAAALAATFAFAPSAQAREHHRHHGLHRDVSRHWSRMAHRSGYRHAFERGGEFAGGFWNGSESRTYRGGLGGRPSAWCGWEMRQLVGGDPGPQFNLARNWAHWGRAGAPGVGAVVVWPHHVGKIVGQEDGKWVIKSGNDGHALRTRPRSIAGAIAIRWG